MIEEIPINSEEVPEAEAVLKVAEEGAETKPKARGRPKGSLGVKKKNAKNEEPAVTPPPPPTPKKEIAKAPAPKKTVRVKNSVNKPPNTPIESENEILPQPPTLTREQHTHQIAAEVMQMLSNRHLHQSQAKREKYRSWFQNPAY